MLYTPHDDICFLSLLSLLPLLSSSLPLSPFYPLGIMSVEVEKKQKNQDELLRMKTAVREVRRDMYT